MTSLASWLVRPTYPWALMLIGSASGSCPARAADWR
jgi:hypothetical protein